MAETQEIVKQIGEIERKLSDGESLLRKSSYASSTGWLFIVVGVLLLIFLGGWMKFIGVLAVGASIWRVYKAEKYKKEIEEGIREYRGRKAELQSSLTTKE